MMNAFYAQSGGVTAVINASACGVIQAARRHPQVFTHVYAGRNGILGALTEDLIDTGAEPDDNIEALRYTPSGAFGSCRYKLKDIASDDSQFRRLIEVFKAHDIGYFFYNGGGDSQDTAFKVSQLGERLGYPIRCIGIPKTVDNDLPFTDTCPGFGSVAKFVAVSAREASLDVGSMAATSTKVFVMEVMGRHAGWIAAAAGLADTADSPIPLVILFPEVAFEPSDFLSRVNENVQRWGYCCVVVSEGVRDNAGRFLSESGAKDAFGHSQLGGVAPYLANLINQSLAVKVHWAVADYLQRAARHVASKTDVEQAYAVGEAAVKLALDGHNAVMPCIKRISSSPYRWEIAHVSLAEVANVERKMPRDFITPDGYGITSQCREYLEPLVLGEDYPPYRNGLPDYVRLQNVAVTKRLSTRFDISK